MVKRKELLRFLVGGGTAVIVDFLLYHLLLHIGIGTAISKCVSFIGGASVGFVINKTWTFESKGFSKGEIIRYICLYSVSAAVNTWTNGCAIQFIPDRIELFVFSITAELTAFFLATGVSTVINFIGQKFFVFRKKG